MQTINKLCGGLEWVCKALMVIIFLVITFSAFMQVFSRNLMSGSWKWTDELCRFCLVWLAFISAAVGVRKGAHLAIDVVVGLLSPPIRRFLSAAGMFLIAGFGLFLVFQGYILSSNTINQFSTVLGFRMGMVYTAIPVSGFIMFAFAAGDFLNMLFPPRAETAGPKEHAPCPGR